MSEHTPKCKYCGIVYDIAETRRTHGESAWIYKYCKAYCYTRASMKQEPSEKWHVSSSTLIVNGAGKVIANFTPLGIPELDLSIQDAVKHCELAVLAVNSHDALVDRLFNEDKYAGGHEKNCHLLHYGAADPRGACDCGFKELKAALAKGK